MNNFSKMCYSEFIAYLDKKEIYYVEETYTDIDTFFTIVTVVKPFHSKLKSRYFDNDGGYQLVYK